MKGIAEQFSTLDITHTNQYLMLAEIFGENEIRSIIEKRDKFEGTIKHLNATIDDYRAYIDFENSLLQSILNVNRYNKTITHLINTIKNKIKILYDTTVTLYSNNLELWYTYINWLRTMTTATATGTTTTTTTTSITITKPKMITTTTTATSSETKTTTTTAITTGNKLTTVNNNIINEIDKMLQCHGEKDESWLYALTVLENIEMDKTLLNSFIRRAVRTHTDNIKLHIKFLYIQLNGKWSESDTIRLKDASVIYEDSKRRMHTIDYYILAIQLVMDYQFCHRTLLIKIIQDMTGKFTRNQRVWQFLKKLRLKKWKTEQEQQSSTRRRRTPPPHRNTENLSSSWISTNIDLTSTSTNGNGNDTVVVDEQSWIPIQHCPYTDELLDKIDLCTRSFESHLKEINNKEIWDEYIAVLYNLTDVAAEVAAPETTHQKTTTTTTTMANPNPKEKNSIHEAIIKAFSNAYQNKCMSESTALKYVEMLMDNKDYEKMEPILESVVIEYPNSKNLWNYYLILATVIKRNLSKTRQMFIHACKIGSCNEKLVENENESTATATVVTQSSSSSSPSPPPPSTSTSTIIDLDSDDCIITDDEPMPKVIINRKNIGGGGGGGAGVGAGVGADVYNTIGRNANGQENLWLWLSYYLYLERYVKNDKEIEQFLAVACNQLDPLFNTFKVIYMQRLSNVDQFDKVRTWYKEISRKKPYCYDIFKLMCAYESFQINVNVDEWRSHCKNAIDYFGGTGIDVWIEYLKFEKRFGSHDLLYDVMKMARTNLPKDLYQKLGANLQKYEPNILKIINVCIAEKKKSK